MGEQSGKSCVWCGMKLEILTTSVLLLALTACASQKPPLMVYQCDNGKGLATQIMSKEHMAVQYEGKVYSMQRKMAASGVRYTGEGYQWWGKGNEGTLTPLPEGKDIATGPGIVCRTAGDRS